MKLSNCHNAPVTMGGVGDFDDRDRVSTQYYVCSECKQACNLADTKDNWLDELLDGETIATHKDSSGTWTHKGTLSNEQLKQAITRRMEQEKLQLMAIVLRELGGRLEIRPKSFIDVDRSDVIDVWDDPSTGNRVYSLAALKKGES